MMLQSHLLVDTVQISPNDRVLILNSAADAFVEHAAQTVRTGTIMLAEDNIAVAKKALDILGASRTTETRSLQIQHTAFHNYTLHHPAGTMDVAVMNLLYQPGNTWMLYGIQAAFHALRQGGQLYVVGAKDRGILSMTKRIQAYFGNVETLTISKGHRVVAARKLTSATLAPDQVQDLTVFAASKLDEGTRLLLDVLEVLATDEALDIGCGAGFIGLEVARRAHQGHVTMVDVSLAAVATTQRAIEQSGLSNARVLPSDGAQAVLSKRFDLVVTNPPFHQGGIQTLEITEHIIRQAAQVLQPGGRFYLVANRFLKYEPTLRACFKQVEEVGGNTKYKVIRSKQAIETYSE